MSEKEVDEIINDATNHYLSALLSFRHIKELNAGVNIKKSQYRNKKIFDAKFTDSNYVKLKPDDSVMKVKQINKNKKVDIWTSTQTKIYTLSKTSLLMGILESRTHKPNK